MSWPCVLPRLSNNWKARSLICVCAQHASGTAAALEGENCGAGALFNFVRILIFETIMGYPHANRGLRGKVLQMSCLSSENLKEEYEPHSTSDATRIPHAPHTYSLNWLIWA
jgi:hypothetical protein